MKEEILRLRAEGKSYNEIVKALGCSKGTIAYHCGPGQKGKYQKRAKQNRKRHAIGSKIDHFHESIEDRRQRDKQYRRKQLQDKTDGFQRKREAGAYRSGKHLPKTFNYKDVIKKFGESTECYLTGRPVDLKEPKTYNFDHVIPVSKGGGHTIDNLGIATREANFAKGNMLVNEFVMLCKDVLEHHGFRVSNGTESDID